MSFTLIDDNAALARLCAHLAGKTWVALDTEFTRERTFYARLGLLQLATDESVVCVDPLRVDLAPLLETLYDPRLLKVLHAGRQDLEVFHDLRGSVPRPVFDTQIAAALLGYAEQIGYGALVEAITGVKLEKLHTRTNWEARPLTAEQLRYAADDVAYLRDVYHALAARLEELGRREWLAQDCDALTSPALYRNDPEGAYLRLNAGSRLAPAQQPLLKALTAWRERTAQARNRPRNWIAPDAALIEIARAAPDSADALHELPAVTAGLANAYGEQMMQVVHDMRGTPAALLWPPPEPPTPAQQETARRLLDRIKQIAEANGINPAAIATRRGVLALVRDRTGPLAGGWRRALVGEELLAMIEAANRG